MNPPEHGPTYWDQMSGRTINERRSFAVDHLYLGDHFITGTPLLCPLSMFERHALIYGPPGSGKTVIAAQLAAQLIARGHTVIMLDVKGSLALLNDALDEVARAVDPSTGESLHIVKLFNPSGRRPSHIYNPLRQRVWLDEPPHARAQTILDSSGIRGEEGTDTAFFAAMGFLIGADLNTWFPDVRSFAEFLSLVNDRHLFAAKGGNPNDWNFSRHMAANFRLLASSGALNGTPESSDQVIDLMDVFVGSKPTLLYFFLSAIEDQRIAAIVGRIVLEQLRKAASRSRLEGSRRRVFVFCDEAQELFGPMFGNALEQLREFGVSLLMFHQSRAQLVTQAADFRERFENAIGAQICLGARTPEEIKYLQDTDREELEYELSWEQPQLRSGNRAMLHPYYGDQVNGTVKVSESKCARLDRGIILNVSSHPQAGFIRGFLNDKLWAFDGSWVPFWWFHHRTPEEFRDFSNRYPERLPGQVAPESFATTTPVLPSGFERAVTETHPSDLGSAIALLADEHRRRKQESE